MVGSFIKSLALRTSCGGRRLAKSRWADAAGVVPQIRGAVLAALLSAAAIEGSAAFRVFAHRTCRGRTTTGPGLTQRVLHRRRSRGEGRASGRDTVAFRTFRAGLDQAPDSVPQRAATLGSGCQITYGPLVVAAKASEGGKVVAGLKRSIKATRAGTVPTAPRRLRQNDGIDDLKTAGCRPKD